MFCDIKFQELGVACIPEGLALFKFLCRDYQTIDPAAAEIASLVAPEDVVVDVTGYPTDADIVIEKCLDPWLQNLVEKSLRGAPFSYEILEDCQDPVCQIDETNVYKQVTTRCMLLAIPCDGGDCNSHAVRCRPSSIRAASQAFQRIDDQFVKQGRA